MNAKFLPRLTLLLLALLGLWLVRPGEASPTQADIIKRSRLAVTANGTDGTATGTATTSEIIQGRIVRVDIDYATAVTATTTDLTVYDSNNLLTTYVVTQTDTYTDTQLFPVISLTTNSGTVVTYDGTYPIRDYLPVAGKLTAAITGTLAATPAVTIDIYYLEDK